jgi:flagellar biosynthesis protein FlhB
MSAEPGEKRFDASVTRKQKAVREGNTARSSEIGGLAAFGSAALATFVVIPLIGGACAEAMRAASRYPDVQHLSPALSATIALAVVPIVAAGLGGSAAGHAQSGGLHIVMPKWNLSKLNPVGGLKRMIGGEAVVGAARASIAFLVAGAAMWPIFAEIFGRATTAPTVAGMGFLALTGAQRAFGSALAVGALFATADYALAHRRWLKQLKMTYEEMKRDSKENDGDPQTRSRRKQAHRALVRGSIQKTKDASFILVNPTHVAIAIRYAPPEVGVPQILVRAADEQALAVKRMAMESHIPIIENIPLARLLYAQGEAGRPIPSETFVAVAYVIAELVQEGALV